MPDRRAPDIFWKIAWSESLCGYALMSSGWTLLKCNEQFARMLGYAPLELCGKSEAEITHPAESTVSIQTADKYGRVDMEKLYITKTGASVRCRLKANPVEHEGELVWFSQILPVDERSNVEALRQEYDQRLESLQRALSATHDDLRAIIGRDIEMRIGDNIGGDKTGRDKIVTNQKSLMIAIALVIAAIAGVKVASDWFTAEPPNNRGQHTAPPNLPATPQDGDE